MTSTLQTRRADHRSAAIHDGGQGRRLHAAGSRTLGPALCRNYHDRNYLQNEFPSLLSDVHRTAARRELVVLETGCGVGNTLLPLTALDPCVRVVGCEHAPKAVAMANQR